MLYTSDFSNVKCMNDFSKNGEGSVYIKDHKLFLDDTLYGKGLTCWLKKEFKGDIEISFDACAVEPCFASNINFFFCAKPLEGESLDLLEFSGSYAQYHEKAQMYIVTQTGDFENVNGKSNIGYSRLRKDPGFALLSETYDMKTVLNQLYRFNIQKSKNQITVNINDKPIHQYKDENLYEGGLLGFRTYYTKLWIDHFKVFNI